MRVRVVAAVLCLVLAKVANFLVPMLFKQLVDVLSPKVAVAIALPLGLLLAYGLVRVTTQVFSELRDGIFARVAQRAIRKVALDTFRHLHALGLALPSRPADGRALPVSSSARREGHRVPAHLSAVQRPTDPARDRHGLRLPLVAF
jgi:ABC-type multidrug transport system fused ATPase/permease subunit